MRRILVCTGVLGGGTALVFALAALTATLLPTGTPVSATWTGFGQGRFDLVAPQVRPAIRLGVPFGGDGTVVIADDTVAGGFVKVRADADGNPVLDANGDPVIDTTGVQP